MAVYDLHQLGSRLKALRQELQDSSGERWTQQDVADAVKVPLRTYAAWEGAEVENRDGEGYKRLARFYTRKLGRKVTSKWILFGDEERPARRASPLDVLSERPAESDLAEQVRETNSELAEVRGELSEVRTELQRVLSLLQRGGHGRGGAGGN